MIAAYDDEVRNAQVLRSLNLVVDSWEHDDLTVEEMTLQLEAVNRVADGTASYATFLTRTNLFEKLN